MQNIKDKPTFYAGRRYEAINGICLYHLEIGLEREEREYEAYKRGEGVLSDRESTKEYVRIREEQERKINEKT